ncbi:S41 family peptidase [Candidatus Gottesmanbacteria bacterium]|nr:S41 family peptidase [Candidatus Gottesmanbacteria bacterium]
MKILPFSTIRKYILIFALLILAGGAGYQLGERHVALWVTSDRRVIINQETPPTAAIDFSLFWDVWGRLFRFYIDRTSLDPQKMVWGAVNGMVNSLGDPYTVFLPPQQNKEFKEDLGGAFDGIGAQLGMKDGHVMVIAPLKGTPAEKAGIRPGDFILKVNDEDTTGWTVEQAVNKIRGGRGTQVILQILHENALKPADVTSIKGLILDLRNNPGGYLDGAVFIASEFLRGGVVVSQVNSDGTKEDFPVDRKGNLLDIPLVVLINKGSASAAEIVAGALKDYARATVVGETSFGKGSVQTPQDLKGGGGLHITTGKWLLPKGSSISKVGIKPDINITLEDPTNASADAQLAKAVNLILQ